MSYSNYPNPPTWLLQLQQCSWRGNIIYVTSDSNKPGRKIAVHDIPYADYPIPEDMGRDRWQISIQGFVNGDDVFDQRNAILDSVLTQTGAGELIHPSLGSLNAWLMSSSLTSTREKGGYIGINFEFLVVAATQQTGPSIDPDTQNSSENAADDLDASSSDDFGADLAGIISQGSEVVLAITATAASIVGTTLAFLSYGNSIINSVHGLDTILGTSGTTGRYNSGNLTATPTALAGVSLALPAPQRVTQGVALMLAAGTSARSLAATTGAAISVPLSAISFPIPASYASAAVAVQNFIELVRVANNDPDDQIQTLVSAINGVTVPVITSTGIINAGINTGNEAIGSLYRRACLASLGRAIAAYQPLSSTEANDILVSILPLFDAEIEYCADNNRVESYNALRALRTTIIVDMQTRGANLPALINATYRASLPDVVVAYKLYQNSYRAAEIVLRNDPINPLFMQTTLEVLSR